MSFISSSLWYERLIGKTIFYCIKIFKYCNLFYMFYISLYQDIPHKNFNYCSWSNLQTRNTYWACSVEHKTLKSCWMLHEQLSLRNYCVRWYISLKSVLVCSRTVCWYKKLVCASCRATFFQKNIVWSAYFGRKVRGLLEDRDGPRIKNSFVTELCK